MAHRNIFAYTAPGSDGPAFVSLNQHHDGRVVLTVRESKPADAAYGETIDVEIPRTELTEFAFRLGALVAAKG